MPITITEIPPFISQAYDRKLLSTPTFGFKSESLLEIACWLLEKIESAGARSCPSTVMKLKQKYKEFMELYERAKAEERNGEEKAFVKAKGLFYRPELTNINDKHLFGRLDDRRKTSKFDRKYHDLSKIW